MKLLNARQYEALIAGATLLRADGFGPKVYALPDGRIVKLFRIKRWLSSSVLYPYSRRFLRNSRRLRRRGYSCVTVDEIFYCHAIRRHGVVYDKLDGEPLDELFGRHDSESDRVFIDYAGLIARLHADRIYFRSVHPGNVLLLPSGDFGFIDIGDIRFPLFPLSIAQRRRNFRHVLRSEEFRIALKSRDSRSFVDAYLDVASIDKDKKVGLRAALTNEFETIPPS